MTNELGPGQARIGRAWDRSVRAPYPAMLRDTGSQIEIVLPYDYDDAVFSRRYRESTFSGDTEPTDLRSANQLPTQIWFWDSNGFVSLVGITPAAATLGGPTTLEQATLRVAYAVFTGDPGIDHSAPNGLCTRIEGLSTWFGMRSLSVDYGAAGDPSAEITIKIAKPVKTSLDRTLNLSVVTGTDWRSSGGVGSTSLEEVSRVVTQVSRSRDWHEHLDKHRAMHELIQVSGWRTFGFEQVQAMHTTDPTRVMSRDVIGERWAPVRTYELAKASTDYAAPWFLFNFEHIGPKGVRRWLRLRKDFRRGILTMMSAVTRSSTSLEGQISDAGIGLEEIGYQVRRAMGITPTRLHHLNLQAIASEVEHLLPFDSAAWASNSTSVYNAVKHPDRPNPSAREMRESLTKDRWVFRVWIAKRLGVPDDVISDRDWLLNQS